MTKEVATLNDTEELLLMYLEDSPNLSIAAQKTGISLSHASKLVRKMKDVIVERTRDKLLLAGLRAADVITELQDADTSTVQGALRLKAAESILDRMGATKQATLAVSVESENGIFILPAKAEVPLEAEYEEIHDEP